MLHQEAQIEAFQMAKIQQECTTPEYRLMFAVLQEALATFQRGLVSKVPAARRDFVEADLWIRSREADSPFAFESICSVLGIDSAFLRTGLARVKHEALAKRQFTKRRQVRREAISDRRVWKGKIGSTSGAGRA